MKLQKSSLAMILAVVLTLTMAVGGTLAYLTDQTDAVANVMTVGNVDITQKEDFEQNSSLYPGVAVKKEVTVENVGNSDAYVRTLISFEMGDMSKEEFLQYVHWTCGSDWTEGDGEVKDGKYVVPFTYKHVLEAGDKTNTPSLLTVTLDKTADNAQVKALANAEGNYIVWAQSQAVQAKGFTEADVALKAAFDGVEPPQVATVATAAELKAVLTSYTDAGSGNGTIEIEADITLADGEVWTPVKIDGYNGAGVITINGNGHTITGLNDTLLAGGFAGNSGVVINDLTIAGAEITSSNAQGYGAFINTVDSMPKIELNNCHLKDSTITDTMGARVGGLIGWTAGYNNTNDGPVDTYVTITNCSVTGCTIEANGSVGAIIGHAGNNPATYHTIEKCTVSGNKLTSNDDSYRVGAIVGTANVGEVTITNCTSTGNTFLQNNAGTEIARPADQSELYGRFVPGTTGKLTIDGAAIN